MLLFYAMSKFHKIKFKFRKDSNQVEIWDRGCLLKTVDELESENFLISFIKNLDKTKSNVLPFERKSLL